MLQTIEQGIIGIILGALIVATISDTAIAVIVKRWEAMNANEN